MASIAELTIQVLRGRCEQQAAEISATREVLRQTLESAQRLVHYVGDVRGKS